MPGYFNLVAVAATEDRWSCAVGSCHQLQICYSLEADAEQFGLTVDLNDSSDLCRA